MNFKINPLVRQYLEVQRDGISHLIGKPSWQAAYEESIEKDFESMKSLLPASVMNILDVGGGMSGLGIRLCKHYENLERKPYLCVLDGIDAPPVVDKYWKPYSSAFALKQFTQENGVHNLTLFKPHNSWWPHGMQFDLVISTQAWCFHLPPRLYATLISQHMQTTGVMIVDVRLDKGWIQELNSKYFELLGGLTHGETWARTAFKSRRKPAQFWREKGKRKLNEG